MSYLFLLKIVFLKRWKVELPNTIISINKHRISTVSPITMLKLSLFLLIFFFFFQNCFVTLWVWKQSKKHSWFFQVLWNYLNYRERGNKTLKGSLRYTDCLQMLFYFLLLIWVYRAQRNPCNDTWGSSKTIVYHWRNPFGHPSRKHMNR